MSTKSEEPSALAADDDDSLLSSIADEFMDKLRAGSRPSVTTYLRRYPTHAEQIRSLLPTLYFMEEVASRRKQDGEAPKRIGNYEIIKEIGRGGMGIVYEAIHEPLQRVVALKLLQRTYADDKTASERFSREARSAAKLHHTNIVPVFDVGEESGRLYYSMQLVIGKTAADVIREIHTLRNVKPDIQAPATSVTPQSDGDSSQTEFITEAATKEVPDGSTIVFPDQSTAEHVTANSERSSYFRNVARIIISVCDAIHYSHLQGVLHRDIKPANILLDQNGHTWITDFGLAVTGESELTETGGIVGTLRYMAPERFRGWADPRSDVYSLGLTLYEMLTLTPAFQEEDQATLMKKVVDESPVRPAQIDSAIPRDLETIVLKAIEKEPAERYHAAGELAADLRRFLDNRPIAARRISLIGRLNRWRRRRPIVARLTAALAALLLLIMIGSTGAALHFRHQSQQLSKQAKTLTKQSAQLRVEQNLTANSLFDSYLNEAQASVRTNEPGRRFRAMTAIRNAVKLLPELPRDKEDIQELRSLGIAAMCLVDMKPEKRLNNFIYADGMKVDGTLSYALCYSPDRKRTELRRFDSGEVLWDVDYRDELIRMLSPGSSLAILLDPTSERLQVFRTETGELIYECDFPNQTFYGYDTHRTSVSSDDRLIAMPVFGDDTGKIRIVDLSDRLQSKPLPDDAAAAIPRQPSWNTSDESNLPEKIISTGIPGAVPFFIPNRRTIMAYNYSSGEVRFINFDSGDVHPTVKGSWGEVFTFGFSPDGRHLAAAARRGYPSWIWDLSRTDLHPETSCFLGTRDEHRDTVFSVDFSPDAQIVATASWDGFTRVFDSTSGQLHLKVRGGGRLFFEKSSEVTPGRLAVSSTHFTTIYNYIAALHRKVVHHNNAWWMDVSPDGRLLAVTDDAKIIIRDAKTLDPLARIPYTEDAQTKHIAFHPKGSLVTSSSSAWINWPLKALVDETGNLEVTVGEGESLGRSETVAGSWNASGDRHAYVFGQALMLADWQEYTAHRFLGSIGRGATHFRLSNVELHPFESLIVSATPENRVVVRDTNEGKIQHELAEFFEVPVRSTFSPDGKTLAVAGRMRSEDELRVGHHFWDTETWQLRSVVPSSSSYGLTAWSQDSSLVAIPTDSGINLLDGRTLESIARFSEGKVDQVRCLEISPDGNRLYVAYPDRVCCWDLQGLRQELSELNLDWETAVGR